METITVVSPGAPTGAYDEQGNPVIGADVTANVVIKAFAPAVSAETAETFGKQTISGGTVYAFPGAVFGPSDRLIIRGVAYQVEGEHGDWVALNEGGPDGVVVAVRRAV